MSLSQRLQFLAWFVRHDLLEWRGLMMNLAAFFGLFLTGLFSILAFGLTVGLEQVREKRWQGNPLTGGLWAERAGQGKVTLAALTAAVDAVRKEHGDTAIEGAYPILQIDLRWRHKTGSIVHDQVGRTVAPGDRVFASLEVAWGGEPLTGGADDEGIVVSPRFLRHLGYNEGESVKELECRSADGGRQNVRVRGTTGVDPPFEYKYLLPERFALRLRNLNEPPILPMIQTGAVPIGWPAASRLPNPIGGPKGWLALWEIRAIDVARTEKLRVWELTYEGIEVAPRRDIWLARLEEMRKELAKHFPDVDAADFDQITQPKEPAPLEPDPPKDYTQAVVYTGPSVSAKTIADALEKNGLRMRRDELTALDTIRTESQRLLQVLFSIGILLLLVIVLTVAVLQMLRMEPKMPEMGMLRAIGMSNGMLLLVYQFEAAIIGIAGGVTGVLTGVCIGPYAARWIHLTHAEFGFVLSPSWVAYATILALWLAAAVASLPSTVRSLWRSPCQLIGR